MVRSRFRSVFVALGFSASLLAGASHAYEYTPERLEALKRKTASGKANMDTYFALAKVAAALGDNATAEQAYRHMLQTDPALDRVRLDLALLLTRTGKYEEAKRLFEEVLSRPGLPDQVRQNVGKVLVTVDKALESHVFSGSLASGWNYDTNGNAASSSDRVTFIDQSIPLTGDATAQKDGQAFVSASLTHQYKFRYGGADIAPSWETTGSFYTTQQAKLSDLEINVLGLQTGPVVEYKPLGLQARLGVGYNYIELDSEEYLNVASVTAGLKHKWNDKVTLGLNSSLENRHFVNTPESTSLSDRGGHAVQTGVNVSYMLDEENFLSATLGHRWENTRQDYYDYNRFELGAGYTRLFPHEIFASLNGKMSHTRYDGPDPIVTRAYTREDRERTASLTLGKSFAYNITGTIGYQYNTVSSNIQNYAYDNHRFLSSVGWRF